MENKKKAILAAVVVALMVTIIILVNITKKKESAPEPVTPTATEIPTDIPSTPTPTPTSTSEPSNPGSDVTLIPTDEPESPTPTEPLMPPLMEQLLKDPFGVETNGPLKSITVEFHGEQTQNLDEENNFFIDVKSRLEESKAEYIPFSITYDSKKEYRLDGEKYRITYTSTELDKDMGMARVYDFGKGLLRRYDYSSSDKKFVYTDTYETDMTEEKYSEGAMPELYPYGMFIMEAMPEMTETDNEYIIKGITTSNGYEANSPNEIVSVEASPAYGFQYLIQVTLRYDKTTMRIKEYVAEVKGKVRSNGTMTYNNPLDERVESPLGVITSVFKVKFDKYDSTTFSGLPPVDEQHEKDKTEYSVYTFNDGSEYYIKNINWKNDAPSYFEEGTVDGFYSLKKTLYDVTSPYAYGYAIVKDLPVEKRPVQNNDEIWDKMLEDVVKRGEENKKRREEYEESTGRKWTQNYERPNFAGYYMQPTLGYLCNLLLDKDGNMREDLRDKDYTGYEYYTLIDIAYNTFVGLVGREEYPVTILEELFTYEPEKAETFWEENPNMKRYTASTSTVKPEHIEKVISIVKEDVRKQFETSLKAWLIKHNIGSATKPK